MIALFLLAFESEKFKGISGIFLQEEVENPALLEGLFYNTLSFSAQATYIPGVNAFSISYARKSFGGSIFYCGDSLYRESSLEISYSSSTPILNYGIKISIYEVYLKGYSSILKPGISLGLFTKNIVNIGFYIKNINSLFTPDNTIFSKKILEFSFQPADNAFIIGGVENWDEFHYYLYTGYLFYKRTGIIVGAKSNPVKWRTVFGISTKKVSFLCSVDYHPLIGISKAGEVCFTF